MAAKPKKNKVNSFKPRKFYDMEIVNSTGHMVGTIRVKPSGILWAPKSAKVWHGAPLKDFAAFMEEFPTQKK